MTSARQNANTWGGKRWTKFSVSKSKIMSLVLWKMVKDAPDKFTLAGLVQQMRQIGFDVNTKFLGRIFKTWRWSWKVPVRFHHAKYSADNIDHYLNYILWIQDIPWYKLKFVDECHFVGRNLHKKNALGPINQHITVVKHAPLGESYSLTLLTSLSSSRFPYFVDLQSESNTQWDFARFVLNSILYGALVPGDYLVADNAAVHVGAESYEFIHDVLQFAGIQLIYLPTYSPELNPCELVFNCLKTDLKNHRGNMALWLEICQALSKISHGDMYQFYEHCIRNGLCGNEK